MNKKIVVFAAALAVATVLFAVWASMPSTPQKTDDSATPMLNFKISATITFWKDGKIVYQFSGLDPLTNLGLDLSFGKLTGNAAYNLTTYNLNCSFVSIGYGTPTSASTVLPGEWGKVAGTQHALVYNGFNITGAITPPAGPNSANCMGINYDGAGLGANDLFAYTTFSTVTGIDNTFSITCELQVQGTTS